MRRDEWICWTLSKEEIDEVAQLAGIDTSKFTKNDYKEVVRNFVKSFDFVGVDWGMILHECVGRVAKKLKGEPR